MLRAIPWVVVWVVVVDVCALTFVLLTEPASSLLDRIIKGWEVFVFFAEPAKHEHAVASKETQHSSSQLTEWGGDSPGPPLQNESHDRTRYNETVTSNMLPNSSSQLTSVRAASPSSPFKHEAKDCIAVVNRMAEVRDAQRKCDLKRWRRNLPPLIAEGYEQQQRDSAAGRPWTGTAVLVTGQVRTGLSKGNVAMIRKNIIDALRGHGGVHVFAVLEFTDGGFASWHQEKNLKRSRNRTFTRAAVENMLVGYGANFTLLEATPPDDSFKPNSSFLSGLTCALGPTGTAQQFMKVDQALKLMELHEARRGRHFETVVRIRPDVLHGSTARKPGPQKCLPATCRSLGGGGGDSYLVADRYAAPAFGNYWKHVSDCPLERVDRCQSRKELHTQCLKHMPDSLCKHMFVTNLLRHGLVDSQCPMAGRFVRP